MNKKVQSNKPNVEIPSDPNLGNFWAIWNMKRKKNLILKYNVLLSKFKDMSAQISQLSNKLNAIGKVKKL